MTTEVTIGDISQAWPVGVRDKDKVQLSLTGFTCSIAVIDVEDNSALVNRAVTQIEDDRFLVYLLDTETALLMEGKEYLLVVQTENLALSKPIKREKHVRFQAVKGFIA